MAALRVLSRLWSDLLCVIEGWTQVLPLTATERLEDFLLPPEVVDDLWSELPLLWKVPLWWKVRVRLAASSREEPEWGTMLLHIGNKGLHSYSSLFFLSSSTFFQMRQPNTLQESQEPIGATERCLLFEKLRVRTGNAPWTNMCSLTVAKPRY